MDMEQFLKNRQEVRPEELERYAAQYIAWSPDGARIVASAKDEDTLEELIRQAGEDPAECVVSAVPELGSALIGGASLNGGQP